ncbi:DUF305 domain-containing protein [Amycolatopsis jiangsuensis]|uniref:Uncharacterized protein (DUF305 family) n=1 Tax=Amycolatopsis jiangsuensis TaxID=1181879 RepID=A0A840J5V5_9PSEU|nr:DUF305 domain-containing protein [Amycolatopsis jiangsuensis]MBB4688797.1 uncharacterized protein (DUF305 family) [Amycolatopsis jiangsuensis]
MTSTEPDPAEPAERPAWSRWVIIGGTLVAVLLVGFAIGLLAARLSGGEETAASPGTGSVEVGFAQDMSVHHLQAVTMANWARDHTDDPEIRQLAFDIASTQTDQVGRMKGWLMLWDQPEQSTGPLMSWMSAPGGHGGMQMSGGTQAASGAVMPGMATDAELAKLRTLSGKSLDVFFLQLMLRHHQGGVPMAEYAQQHTNLPAVKALCRSILTSQGAEMEQMKQMLQARGAQPLPAA